jgi:DUF1365 family protein
VRHAFAYPTCFLHAAHARLRAHGAARVPARNRVGWLAFHDADHGDGRGRTGRRTGLAGGAAGPAKASTDADGEIWLHTYPRVLGYAFKPVSFWYCHRADGTPGAPCVAEVNNTFGERHCYLLAGAALAWRQRAARPTRSSTSRRSAAVEGRYRFRFMRTRVRACPAPWCASTYDDARGALLQTSVSGDLRAADARDARGARSAPCR